MAARREETEEKRKIKYVGITLDNKGQ